MLRVADRAQRGFFDPSWCDNVVPRDSFYGLLAGVRERLGSLSEVANALADNLPAPKLPSGKSRRRRKTRRRDAQAQQAPERSEPEPDPAAKS